MKYKLQTWKFVTVCAPGFKINPYYPMTKNSQFVQLFMLI